MLHEQLAEAKEELAKAREEVRKYKQQAPQQEGGPKATTEVPFDSVVTRAVRHACGATTMGGGVSALAPAHPTESNDQDSNALQHALAMAQEANAKLSEVIEGHLRQGEHNRAVGGEMEQAQQSTKQSEKTIAALRRALRTMHMSSTRIDRAITQASSDGLTATSRSAFLQSLDELIGQAPKHSWREEWTDLLAEFFKLTNKQAREEWDPDFLRSHPTKYSLEAWIDKYSEVINDYVKVGWPEEHAQLAGVLLGRQPAIGRALKQHDRCYAASTYALCEALVAAQQRADAAGRPLQKDIYKNLTGPGGLDLEEPGWVNIEQADQYGYRGLCVPSATRGQVELQAFQESGFCRKQLNDDKTHTFIPIDSPVVRFISEPTDASGAMHAAVTLANEDWGCFPPNTL